MTGNVAVPLVGSVIFLMKWCPGSFHVNFRNQCMCHLLRDKCIWDEITKIMATRLRSYDLAEKREFVLLITYSRTILVNSKVSPWINEY